MTAAAEAGAAIWIGTHSGHFHVDEVLATWMLQQLPENAGAKIIRTRDPARLADCQFVVDVGGVYDPSRHRYDHHQPSFSETFSPAHRIKLSSAGLIYKHFGRRLLSIWLRQDKREGQSQAAAAALAQAPAPAPAPAAAEAETKETEGLAKQEQEQEQEQQQQPQQQPQQQQIGSRTAAVTVAADELTDAVLDQLFLQVYRAFVQALDAIDNGVPAYPGQLEPPAYEQRTDLSSRVGQLNPSWLEEDSCTDEELDRRFARAQQLAGSELLDCVQYYGRVWWPARALVKRAILERFQWHETGAIVRLERACPWKEHLFDLEEELLLQSTPALLDSATTTSSPTSPLRSSGLAPLRFVLYPESSSRAPSATAWRVQAVPLNPSSFVNRQSLGWKGLRDQELSLASGIPDCIFVHMGGFVGGNRSFEGALQMAIRSLS